MGMLKLNHWIRDYVHLGRGYAREILYRRPPKHYLGYIEANKAPIIFIPAVFTTWRFAKRIIDVLSLRGHPIYVIRDFGYHRHPVPESAEMVRRLIEEKNLHDVVLVAYSKGGLVGKYILVFLNNDHRVKKLIAIATPFGGSSAARLIPVKPIRELSPQSPVINMLRQHTEVNGNIVSIYGVFDNHVWPVESCRLDGARNIQLEEYGHHAILGSKKLREVISEIVE